MPLFCDTALAARIERAEARLVAAASEAAHRRAVGGAVTGAAGGSGAPGPAGFVIPVAGGVASFAEDGSPFNRSPGSVRGVPGPDELEEIERAFAACHARVQIELAPPGRPAIGALLSGAATGLVSFENVLGLPSPASRNGSCRPGLRSGAAARTSSGRGLDVVVEASIHPDAEGVPSREGSRAS